MKMNIRMCLMMALVSVMAVTLNSCDKDEKDVAKPKITLTEVGHDNSKHAHPGHDMHLEADIIAEGLVRSIIVEIHQEDGSFEIEKSYVEGKYIGVRNVEFHEHIDIPENAPLGEYHLHLTVTDKEGQQSMAETHVNIVEDDGDDDDEDDHHHED
jgi:hypothetical protein